VRDNFSTGWRRSVERVTEIVPLGEAQIEKAAEVLGRAFFDDPFEVYMLPDDESRERLSSLRFARLLRYGHLFGKVYTTVNMPQAAAIWLPPGNWEMTEERLKQAGLLDIPSIIGSDAFQRLISVTDYIEPYHRKVPARHWYLLIMGVDRSLQGRGLGGALLKPVLEQADADAMPCYLETFQPKNLPFYGRHGFHVLTEGVEPTSTLRYWTLLREPVR
jgi:GNAT superfamily N-acetyltransferase